MKRIFLCILCALLLSGCGSSSNEEPQPTQGEPRPGITGTLTPSATPTPSIDPLLSPTPTLTPIPEGKLLRWQLTEERAQSPDGITLTKRSYDENGLLNQLEKYQGEGTEEELQLMEEYHYDEQGNCIFERKVELWEWGQKSEDVTRYRYEQGRLVEKQTCDSEGKPFYIESYQYLEDGSMRCEYRRVEENLLEFYYICKYDENGNVIEKRYFDEGEESPWEIYEAEYCEHGIIWSFKAMNLIRRSNTDQSPLYIINRYQYDTEGNLIKKITITSYFQSDFSYREEETYPVQPKVTYEWRKVYGEDGSLLEEIRLKEDGSDSLHKKTYRYDDYGNCIEMIEQRGPWKTEFTYVYEPIFEK